MDCVHDRPFQFLFAKPILLHIRSNPLHLGIQLGSGGNLLESSMNLVDFFAEFVKLNEIAPNWTGHPRQEGNRQSDRQHLHHILSLCAQFSEFRDRHLERKTGVRIFIPLIEPARIRCMRRASGSHSKILRNAFRHLRNPAAWVQALFDAWAFAAVSNAISIDSTLSNSVSVYLRKLSGRLNLQLRQFWIERSNCRRAQFAISSIWLSTPGHWSIFWNWMPRRLLLSCRFRLLANQKWAIKPETLCTTAACKSGCLALGFFHARKKIESRHSAFFLELRQAQSRRAETGPIHRL